METKNIKQLFTDKHFVIPFYQRGYAWKEDQLKHFWEDLIDLDNGEHYTGVITLQKITDNHFNVVDGQQRLTTTIILINEIYKKLGDEELFKTFIKNNNKYLFQYEKDTPSDDYFKKKILEQDPHLKTPEETFYTNNLRKAKEFFQKKLAEYDNEKINSVLKDLTENFIINEYIIADNFDINASFETMNNRGRHLSKLELLKNRFFYLINKSNLQASEKLELERNINLSWNTIYGELGKEKNNLLDDDDFLANHWLSYKDFKYSRNKGGEFGLDLLGKKWTLKSLKDENGYANPQTIQSYIQDLSGSAKHYYSLHCPEKSYDKKDDKDLILWLTRIERLGFFSFKPMIMNALKLYPNNKKDVVELLTKIEQFIFVCFAFCGFSASYRNNIIFNLAKENNIQESLKELDKIMRENVMLECKLNIEEFERYSKISKQDYNFYKWRYLRYLLYEYEYSLMSEARQDEVSFPFKRVESGDKNISIEHIAPQTVTQEWKEAVKEEGKNFAPKRYEKEINLLGNLLLLKDSINAELSNKPFSDKKIRFKKDSLSAIEVSEKRKWNGDQIIKRGIKILEFASKRWQLNLTKQEIEKISDNR